MDGNLGDMLRRRARTNPKADALVDLASGVRCTYPELNARSNAVAHGLARLGVGPGGRVALLCLNGVEFVETYYAVAKMGAVVVPLNWRLTAPELTFILKDCGAKVLIFGSAFAEVSEAIKADGGTDVSHFVEIGDSAAWAARYADMVDYAETDEPATTEGGDEPVTIVYTSGTTGLPKGVVHTHRTALAGPDERAGDHRVDAVRPVSIGAAAPPCRGLDPDAGASLPGRALVPDAAVRPREDVGGDRGRAHHQDAGRARDAELHAAGAGVPRPRPQLPQVDPVRRQRRCRSN